MLNYIKLYFSLCINIENKWYVCDLLNFILRGSMYISQWVGWGKVLQVSSAGMIEGFFWVGKFWKVFFRWLDLRRDFFGYSKQSEDFVIVPTYSWHIVLQIHFYGFINSAWDFLGVKFWSRDFFRFFWVLIFAPIQSSMSLDIQGIPPPGVAK